MYCLLEKGQATAPELAEKLEVSVRTIYRDLDMIILQADSISSGGRILATNGAVNTDKKIDIVFVSVFHDIFEESYLLTALFALYIPLFYPFCNYNRHWGGYPSGAKASEQRMSSYAYQ